MAALILLAACSNDDQPATTFDDFGDGSTTGGVDDNLTTSISAGTVDSTAGSQSGDSGSSSGGVVSTSTGTMSTGMVDGTDSSSGEPVADCDQIDVPDINGLDENGDGLDGLLGCSVFVNAATGSDLNDGDAPDVPVATIERGIDIANSYNPPRPVLVAEGTYNETVNLSSGVSLYGGYDDMDWARDVFANETIIEGQESRAVIGINLNEAVEVDGFTIRGQDFADMSQSTYGVWIKDTPDGILAIDYCLIEAGDAGAGGNGTNGLDGEDGGNGANGASNGDGGAFGTSGCGATGGGGGDGNTCPTTAGGNGSAGGDPTTVGLGGAAGTSHCAGNVCNDEGENGVGGNAGAVGVNGTGGIASADPDGDFGGDGLWVPPVPASTSTRGNHGGGGGGGAGGCGGAAGGTGQPGGGTFALVAANSSIEVSNTDFFLGAGGNGGNGGNGGDGGIPGTPGNGASGTDNGGEPGNGAGGGAGGGGGGGGGGSGGCGGSSIGIVRVGGSAVATANISYSGGAAGTSGTGGAGGLRADPSGQPADPGQNGCAGLVADDRDYP